VDASKRKTAASRSWLAPTCASGSILVTLLLGACLNPRPEELPSERDAVGTTNIVPDNGGGPVAMDDDPGGTTGSGNDPALGGSEEGSGPDTVPASPSPPPSAPEAGEGTGAPDAGVDGGSATGTPLMEGDP
jgi:hypothetical protein